MITWQQWTRIIEPGNPTYTEDWNSDQPDREDYTVILTGDRTRRNSKCYEIKDNLSGSEIRDTLRNADITHINNEVLRIQLSCPFPGR